MVTLLRKLFIKDYRAIDSIKVRTAHAYLSAGVGIVLNLILVALKLTGTLLMAAENHWVFSMALLGDSLNNLFDFTGELTTVIGFKVASKPADAEHPYGHQRAEYIAGILIGIVIIVSGAFLLYESISGIVAATSVDYSLFALIALGVTLPVKALQSYVNFSLGKLLNSPALKSVALDSLSDMGVSSVLLIFALLSRYVDMHQVDSYLGLFLSAVFFYAGFKAIKEASDPILGEPMSKKTYDRIVEIATSTEGVLAIHDVIAHNYGENVRYLYFHAEMDARLPFQQAHDIIHGLEHAIEEELGYRVSVHMDPVDISSPEITALREKIEGVLSSIDSRLKVHAIRLKEIQGHSLITLGVEMPYKTAADEETKIKEALSSLGYEIEITIDHSYSKQE